MDLETFGSPLHCLTIGISLVHIASGATQNFTRTVCSDQVIDITPTLNFVTMEVTGEVDSLHTQWEVANCEPIRYEIRWH